MNDKAEKVLEFNKIKDLLAQEAVSPMAKKAVGEIVPLTDDFLIRDLLKETDEAAAIVSAAGAPPFGGLCDVKRSVRYAEKGGVLSMRELLDIKSSLQTASQVKNFLLVTVAEGPLAGKQFPVVTGLAEMLSEERRLCDHIDRCILSEDEMADGASPLLRDIRRKISQQTEAARMRIHAMISSSANKGLLQDDIVTMRDGRFVIPVKQENRSRFPGIIHDRSSSGATLFIEPQAVVNMNNEIRELEMKEQDEIRRILAELSAEAGKSVRQVINNQKYLTKLDVIFAKGRLSVRYNGCSARINTGGILDIRRGRHPLIDPEKAVPIDISAGKNYRTLVITGPNTGGKTVTLKTVGLMILMTQAGLHIPAQEGSEIPVMQKVFADIGDEQSIEQSLSTFSSHMKNIVEIIGGADGNTFVLIDELGAGTDPTEGAALAISILEKLSQLGAMTMATTHYSELKKYAIATRGVENASMEFDIETLSPTYRLTIGTPGRSNAFEISKKLGLDDEIIDYARNLLGTDDIEFENVISAIQQNMSDAEAERDQALELKLRLKKQEEEFALRQEQAEEKRRKIIEKARREAGDMIAEAKEFAEEVKRELRELQKEGPGEETRSKQLNIRRRLMKKSDEYREVFQPAVNAKPAERGELKIGDRVNVVSLGQKGTVASLPDDRDELLVQIGPLKVKIKLTDLTKIDKNGVQKRFDQPKYSRIYQQKTMNISTEINVIGLTLDDAVMKVDKYLDDAYMSGLPQVSVIHGKGAGILRNGLKQLFRQHAHVDSYRPGDYYSGGDGVTVVTLK